MEKPNALLEVGKEVMELLLERGDQLDMEGALPLLKQISSYCYEELGEWIVQQEFSDSDLLHHVQLHLKPSKKAEE
ncbi:MAG: hypothetical protein JXR40_14680 [Pontiellaceae bacterium]|nr:hypothetical protein [Pontiellaceae bacterium]